MKKSLQMINPFKPYQEDMPAALYVVQKLLGFLVIFLCSAFTAEILIILLLSMAGVNILGDELPDTLLVQSAPLFGYLVFAAFTVIYVLKIERRSLASMGFTGPASAYLKGAVVGVVLLLAPVLVLILMQQYTYEGFNSNADFWYVAVFFAAYVVQGMGEELLCRGYLLTSLARRISFPVAVFISSLMFALPHFGKLFGQGLALSIIGLANLMLFSLLVSLYMQKDRNIYLAFAIHSIWNFLLAVICGISVSGNEASASSVLLFKVHGSGVFTGGAYGPEGSLAVTAVLILAVTAIRMHTRKPGTAIPQPIR